MSQNSDDTLMGDAHQKLASDPMSEAVDDVTDVCVDIRYAIHAIYSAVLDEPEDDYDTDFTDFIDSGKTDGSNKTHDANDANDANVHTRPLKSSAYKFAKYFVFALESCGKGVERLPQEGRLETATMLADLISKANFALAASKEKTPDLEFGAIVEIIQYKCHGQLIQGAHPACKRIVSQTSLCKAIIEATDCVGSTPKRTAVQIARIVNPVLVKYVHSVAVGETVSSVSDVYCEYAEKVLSTLDRGDSENTKDENSIDMEKTTAVFTAGKSSIIKIFEQGMKRFYHFLFYSTETPANPQPKE